VLSILFWCLFWCRFDLDAADLFSKLLNYDKEKRMVAQPAMSHPYFKCFGSKAAHLPPGMFSIGNCLLLLFVLAILLVEFLWKVMQYF